MCISPIVQCFKVTNFLQVIDPTTLQSTYFIIHWTTTNIIIVADIPANVYWRSPFSPLFDHRHFTQFLILQCEVISDLAQGVNSTNKCVLSDAWVSPLEEMDRQVHCRTHLGHILNPGDIVWGWVYESESNYYYYYNRVDFTRANLNNDHLELLKPSSIPDVVRLYARPHPSM